MRRLLLYGPGGIGQQTAFLLKTHFSKEFEIIGFVADKMAKGTDVYEGLRVVGPFEEILHTEGMRPSEASMLATVGYVDMDERRRVVRTVKAAGYHMPNIVSPFAIVETNVDLGKGIILCAGVVVDNHSKIDDCVFMNPGVCIAHECEIGEGTILAPRAALGGYVKIGQYTFVGINSTIINNINIGDFVFINAASLVSEDVPNYSKYRERHIPEILKRRDIGDGQ